MLQFGTLPCRICEEMSDSFLCGKNLQMGATSLKIKGANGSLSALDCCSFQVELPGCVFSGILTPHRFHQPPQ